jgi:hypothetical protein
MDYAALRSGDAAALAQLRRMLGRVDPAALTPQQRLAYWINLYNVNVAGIVVDHYPIDSIRDLSTDPLVRLNVFKKPLVPFGSGAISLNDIENERLRQPFHDPRIHFAINCGARSCPPLRREAYTGAHIGEQLDDQARAFAAGSGVRLEQRGDTTVVHTTKIMQWFKEDFETWSQGPIAFLQRVLPVQKRIPTGNDIKIEYDDYDWTLNDWKRPAAAGGRASR